MPTTIWGRAGKFNIGCREERLTAHAGIVLLRDFIERLGVPQVLDDNLHLKRGERGYPESENILSLCWNRLLGGPCLLDLDVLRGDPGLPALRGVKSVLAPTTAGEFLRAFTLGDWCDLRRVNRVLAQRRRAQQQSTRVTIALEASLDEQCATRKQGSRQHYPGQVGYYPLVAFWAEEKELLATPWLRGNAHASPKALWVLQQARQQAPAGWPLYLRADSEFYSWALWAFCTLHKITYAITADPSPGLKQALTEVPEKAWKPSAPGLQVVDLWYAPSGHETQRYVAKRPRRLNKQTKQNEWRDQVVMTNDQKRSAKKVLQGALGRSTVENKSKEHKTDFGWDKMPTHNFHANWAWLLIGQGAWHLLAWFNRTCLPESSHKLRLGTLRHRLLKVAGKIVQRSRQRFLLLSDQYWFQDGWVFALKQ